jgi:hypothetical protein
MTIPMNLSLPPRGRAGVGADGLQTLAASRPPLAPIPTFPQRGKAQNR